MVEDLNSFRMFVVDDSELEVVVTGLHVQMIFPESRLQQADCCDATRYINENDWGRAATASFHIFLGCLDHAPLAILLFRAAKLSAFSSRPVLVPKGSFVHGAMAPHTVAIVRP